MISSITRDWSKQSGDVWLVVILSRKIPQGHKSNLLLRDEKFGKPSKIITDHGTQFTSPIGLEFFNEKGIQPVFSSIRHPQNNIVERIHRELSRFFKCLIGENYGSWWSWINMIESCMNETYHENIQFTPIELHLNKKPKRA